MKKYYLAGSISDEDREQIFEKKAKQRRQEFEKSFNIELNDEFNPYQILRCSPDSNIEVIKKNYKTLAFQYHPDKPTGNTQQFQLITKAYLYLVNEYKKKSDTTNFVNLKHNFKDYTKQQDNSPLQNVNMENENFNLKLFNKIFMENHISDP